MGEMRDGIHADDATTLLRDRGIRVFADPAEAEATLGQAVQVITFFQVLEHVADFRSFLAMCRKLLAPGGWIVCSVPNGQTIREQQRWTHCPDMFPNHINKWSQATLEPERWRRRDSAASGTSRTGELAALCLRDAIACFGHGQSAGFTGAPRSLPNAHKRWMRIPFLAAASGSIYALPMLPHLGVLSQGSAAMMVAGHNAEDGTAA